MSNLIKPGNFRKVTHCIFDMDGLLLDTEKLYTEAFQSILDPYGHTFTWDLKLQLMGLHHDEVCKIVVDHYSLPMTWQEFSVKNREATTALMSTTQLLPDTEPIYEEIVRRIAKQFGKPYPHDVRMKIMGTTEQRSAEIAIKDLKLPLTYPEYMKKYKCLCFEMLGDNTLLKGAEKLVRHLHETKTPFSLATSSGEEMVNIKTKNHKELFDLFGHKVCGSTDPDVKHGKPAPDIFLIAASRFADQPKAEACLVFEDAPNGVTAGISAGMQVVMVPDQNVPKEMTSHATIVLKSLEDFRPELFGLPPYKC